MLNLMEGVIPEFDREGVVRCPSGSSVTGIVPTGAYPCTPAPGSPPDYVIIGANADSMLRAADAHLTGPAFAKNHHRVARRVEIEDAIVARAPGTTLRTGPDRGACRARFASVRDIVTNEQVRERGAVEFLERHIVPRTRADDAGRCTEAGGWMACMLVRGGQGRSCAESLGCQRKSWMRSWSGSLAALAWQE